MTIKDLAYRIQRNLKNRSRASFKRSHIYELLAAAFGRASYAALCVDSVFAQVPLGEPLPQGDEAALRRRCAELGHEEGLDSIVTTFRDEMSASRVMAVHIQDVVDHLRAVSADARQDDLWTDEMESNEPSHLSLESVIHAELEEPNGFLLESLHAAAERSNALAHYALALFYRDEDEDDLSPQGSAYWHQQRLLGEQLSSAANQWADNYENQVDRSRRADFHLREAANLGDAYALLDMAEFHGDPTFFERSVDPSIIDEPFRVADIAGRMTRRADEQLWLTRAAESGDMEAIEALIASYDQDAPERIWVWVYLGRLLGTDLTRSDMRAYHLDGPQADQEYDDDFGGGAYVAGREALGLEPLPEDADRIAKEQAEELYRRILERRA